MKWMLVALIIFMGCKHAAIPIKDKPVLPSKPLAESAAALGKAGDELQQSGIKIKAETAKEKPSATVIDKEADKVIAGANTVVVESVNVKNSNDDVIALQNRLDEQLKYSKKLENRIVDLTNMVSKYMRYLILGALAAIGIGVGWGSYVGNLRLIIAAPLAGGAVVVGAIITGAIYEWRNAILIGLGVAAVVVLIGLFIDWKEDGKIGNLFRAKDK